MSPTPEPPPRLADYQDAAALRAALRTFLHRSEALAAHHGLTPQRHSLLLFIKGAPDGTERATITDLAERLRLAKNTVTDLVARAERAGLLGRETVADDRRRVLLHLTPEGETRLAGTVAALRADRAGLIELVRAQTSR